MGPKDLPCLYYFCYLDAGGMVKFWHVATSSVLQTIHEPRQILAGSLSPEGTTFVTGGTTEQMNVYDVETSKKIHCCETRLKIKKNMYNYNNKHKK